MLTHVTLMYLTFASLWIVSCLPDWVKQKQLKTNCRFPSWQAPLAWPRFNVQYNVTTRYQISETPSAARRRRFFVCTEQQRSWAGCAESEVVGSHEKILHISDQRALARHQVSAKPEAPWGYSARWDVQCHTAAESRYQVCREVMCGLFLWFFLRFFIFLQACGFSLQCDINDGIKILKLCCANNKLSDAMYISVLM